MSDEASPDVTSLTVQLLSAYLANNTVPSTDLPGLIATTRAALLAPTVAQETATEETFEPAVSVRKSLASEDHIISMIDGKRYAMLARHLSKHGLTPAEYRARYKLPSDYPMVARAYSEKRRALAKEFGLGRKGPMSAAQAPALPTEVEDAPASAAPKRNRNPKVASVPPADTVPVVESVTTDPVDVAAANAVAVPKAPRKPKPKNSIAGPAAGSAEVADVPAAKKARKAKATGDASPPATLDESVAPKAKAKQALKAQVSKAAVPVAEDTATPTPENPETTTKPAAKRAAKAKVKPDTDADATKAKPAQARRMARAVKPSDELSA